MFLPLVFTYHVASWTQKTLRLFRWPQKKIQRIKVWKKEIIIIIIIMGLSFSEFVIWLVVLIWFRIEGINEGHGNIADIEIEGGTDIRS